MQSSSCVNFFLFYLLMILSVQQIRVYEISDYILTNSNLYDANENFLNKENNLIWEQFYQKKNAIPRSLYYGINKTILSSLTKCSSNVIHNITKTISANDKKWCLWSQRSDGGQVKIGQDYGKLTPAEIKKYDDLLCDFIGRNIETTCDAINYGDSFIHLWKRSKVNGLCEEKGVTSKHAKSRLCIFENAMLNFKKMRNRKSYVDGKGYVMARAWEQGFIAADCGEMAPENIGYLQMYMPYIDGHLDAKCDYVFNETVFAYSHDNIKSLGQSVSDFMNVWTMLWLSGLSRFSRDISFLNIDGFRSAGITHSDEFGPYFRHYAASFRRVIKASFFGSDKKVCFKRLVMQPKPSIPYLRDGWLRDIPCTFTGPSSLFQRFNLHLRYNHNMLKESLLSQTNEKIRIIFLLRSSKNIRSISNADAVIPVVEGYFQAINNHYVNYNYHSDEIQNHSSYTNDSINHLIGVQNPLAISSSKSKHRKSKKHKKLEKNSRNVLYEFEVYDLSKLSFEEQIRLIGTSSILISMHGAGIASSMHMPVGTKYCCGVIEIFPHGEFKPIRGFGNLARRFGFYYDRIEIPNNSTRPEGSELSATGLIISLQYIISNMIMKPSCILSNVIKKPFL